MLTGEAAFIGGEGVTGEADGWACHAVRFDMVSRMSAMGRKRTLAATRLFTNRSARHMSSGWRRSPASPIPQQSANVPTAASPWAARVTMGRSACATYRRRRCGRGLRATGARCDHPNRGG
jgi:hypothetical protein